MPLSVSKNSTRSPAGMPLARKSKIFGLHSLLLRNTRKYSLGARIFFDRGAITPSFSPPQAAVGCYAPWVFTPVLLKNSFSSYFSLTRCFSAAQAWEKRRCGVNAAKTKFLVYRQPESAAKKSPRSLFIFSYFSYIQRILQGTYSACSFPWRCLYPQSGSATIHRLFRLFPAYPWGNAAQIRNPPRAPASR